MHMSLILIFQDIESYKNLLLGKFCEIRTWAIPIKKINLKKTSFARADLIKLYFFANEDFFRFLLVSLRVYYIKKKNSWSWNDLA